MNIAESFTAAFEFLIAAVIFWEMEENRRDRFQSEAADIKLYESRRKVYDAFYGTEGEDIRSRSETFCNRIWKVRADEDAELRRGSEQQIVLFNRLGQILRRASIYRTDYIRLFPHAVILFWVILEPYIQKRRTMTGEWWACDFEQLTKECLLFVLEKPDAKIGLYDKDPVRNKNFVLNTDELRRLEARLRDTRGKLRRAYYHWRAQRRTASLIRTPQKRSATHSSSEDG